MMSGGDPLYAVESIGSGPNSLDDLFSSAMSKASSGPGLAPIDAHPEHTRESMVGHTTTSVTSSTIVHTRSGLPVAIPYFTWCDRPTHSDVICISNTSREHRLEEHPGLSRSTNRKGRICRLPYSAPRGAIGSLSLLHHPDSMDAGFVSSDTSAVSIPPLRKEGLTIYGDDLEAKARARLNMELVKERDAFMERLRIERQSRLEAEANAATSIQACFRGFATRPHSEAVALIKDLLHEQRLDGEESVEAAMLQRLDVKLGMPSIPGVTLPRKKKTRKQVLKQQRKKAKEDKSAAVVQSVARRRFAKREKAKKIHEKEAADMKKAAFSIQRIYRGHHGRQDYQAEREDQSVTAIQNKFRMMRSQRRINTIRAEKLERNREEVAATTLQAAARGASTRRAASPIRATTPEKKRVVGSELPEGESELGH